MPSDEKWWKSFDQKKQKKTDILSLLAPGLLSTYFLLKKSKLNARQEEAFSLTKAVLNSEAIKWTWDARKKAFICQNFEIELQADGSLLLKQKRGGKSLLIGKNNIIGGLLKALSSKNNSLIPIK